MSEFRTVGIVLKRQNYGEADRILKIFTTEYGMVSALAKGIRKVKSKKAGALELFRTANFHLHRRNSELFLITNAAPKKSADLNDASLPTLAVAYSIAEYLLTLLPAEKPLPQVYELAGQTFQALQKNKKLPLIELAFQSRLLSLLGFLPEFGEQNKAHRLLRFLVSSDFSIILRLTEDTAVFNEANGLLAKIYAEIHDHPSRVKSVTADWIT